MRKESVREKRMLKERLPYATGYNEMQAFKTEFMHSLYILST